MKVGVQAGNQYLASRVESLRYAPGALKDNRFNFDVFLRDPGYLAMASWFYQKTISKIHGRDGGRLDLLVFVKDNPTVPLIGLICTAHSIWLPPLIVQPENEKPEYLARILYGKRVAIVVDQVAGKEILKLIEIIESYGAKVSAVVAYVVWLEQFKGVEKEINDQGVEVHYLCGIYARETAGEGREFVPVLNQNELEPVP